MKGVRVYLSTVVKTSKSGKGSKATESDEQFLEFPEAGGWKLENGGLVVTAKEGDQPVDIAFVPMASVVAVTSMESDK